MPVFVVRTVQPSGAVPEIVKSWFDVALPIIETVPPEPDMTGLAR